MLDFPESYFEGEERDGFYIRPMIKRAWAAQLEVLLEIDAVCKRHNIRWFADSGTLLGAVRCGGYIAWDDDMDIAMFRKDYEVFMKYAKEELPDIFFVYNGRGEGERISDTTSVRDVKGVNTDRWFLERFHGCPYSVGVDIFQLDKIPKNQAEAELLRNFASAIYNIASFYDGKKSYDEQEEQLKNNISEIEELLNKRLDKTGNMKAQLFDLLDYLAAEYMDDDDDCDVAKIQFWSVSPRKQYPIELYKDVTYLPFECIEIPVPKDYKEVLRLTYGDDYMTPRMDGGSHDYPYFRGTEKWLRNEYEKLGYEMPKEFII